MYLNIVEANRVHRGYNNLIRTFNKQGMAQPESSIGHGLAEELTRIFENIQNRDEFPLLNDLGRTYTSKRIIDDLMAKNPDQVDVEPAKYLKHPVLIYIGRHTDRRLFVTSGDVLRQGTSLTSVFHQDPHRSIYVFENCDPDIFDIVMTMLEGKDIPSVIKQSSALTLRKLRTGIQAYGFTHLLSPVPIKEPISLLEYGTETTLVESDLLIKEFGPVNTNRPSMMTSQVDFVNSRVVPIELTTEFSRNGYPFDVVMLGPKSDKEDLSKPSSWTVLGKLTCDPLTQPNGSVIMNVSKIQACRALIIQTFYSTIVSRNHRVMGTACLRI